MQMCSVTGDEGFELIESKITSCKFACKLEICAEVTYLCHVRLKEFLKLKTAEFKGIALHSFQNFKQIRRLIDLFYRRVLNISPDLKSKYFYKPDVSRENLKDGFSFLIKTTNPF